MRQGGFQEPWVPEPIFCDFCLVTKVTPAERQSILLWPICQPSPVPFPHLCVFPALTIVRAVCIIFFTTEQNRRSGQEKGGSPTEGVTLSGVPTGAETVRGCNSGEAPESASFPTGAEGSKRLYRQSLRQEDREPTETALTAVFVVFSGCGAAPRPFCIRKPFKDVLLCWLGSKKSTMR